MQKISDSFYVDRKEIVAIYIETWGVPDRKEDHKTYNIYLRSGPCIVVSEYAIGNLLEIIDWGVG